MLGLTTLLLWSLPTTTVVLVITSVTVLVMVGFHTLAEIGRKADANIEAQEDEAALAEAVDSDTSTGASAVGGPDSG